MSWELDTVVEEWLAVGEDGPLDVAHEAACLLRDIRGSFTDLTNDEELTLIVRTSELRTAALDGDGRMVRESVLMVKDAVDRIKERKEVESRRGKG